VLSIKKCKRILNKNRERKYKHEEVMMIREKLHQLAELEVKRFMYENNKKS